MTTYIRRRQKRKIPTPPQTFKTLDEVADWANKLFRALTENLEDGYGGDVVFGSTIPSSKDGRDGDIWVKH